MRSLIWSVSWGDYRYMTQSLISSINNNNIDCDTLVFCDTPLFGTTTYELDKNIELDFKQYWKFYYLNKIKDLDYDIFIFIDSDHFFVRKPNKSFEDILGEDPWHSFLESPINSVKTKRPDWWGVKNNDMVSLYRQFGVAQEIIYNTNGGLWICSKKFITQAVSVALEFRDFQKTKSLDLPEEVAISVLSHMFSKNYENRFHENYHDIWASEWTGVLKNKLPDGSAWACEEYMTNTIISVNPAIVHAMRSKDVLTNHGKKILNSANNISFKQW